MGDFMAMNDHQDSEHFSYTRTWDEIENMLKEAERTLNHHQMKMFENRPPKGHSPSKLWTYHARNFKALQGVVKTLRWTLGDKDIRHPLD